jgi:hypothetical protein
MTRPSSSSETSSTLLPLPVAVDLIRFEKNLLQMGFFGAHDTRHRSQSTRRLEQWVNRNGQKMKVVAEFRGSEELGLPSTSDRDKYIAFMKIAMEQRVKLGRLENPFRFTGYQMLKELGLTFSGENYEDINRWGQRMADTSITSEQVIYLAARKRYANQTVHVFRSFTRAGHSKLDNSGRSEAFEVVLEDWMLENLNHSYVIPEDFNAYRKLTRPTGKGIFGYLHLWFHASHGRPIEKDYAELCMMLNIPGYKHVSKIKETMGKSLDELEHIGYLSQWEVRPMTTKPGYKLVLAPGPQLMHVLAISQRKQLGEAAAENAELSAEQKEACEALTVRGISPAKAANLVRRFPPDSVLDQMEYAEFLIARDRRHRIENPGGFIIYVIESQTMLPADFLTSRQARERQAQRSTADEAELRRAEALDAYHQFVDGEVEQAIRSRYPEMEKRRKLKSIVAERAAHDPNFACLGPMQQEPLAEQMLRRDLRDELPLPTFEEWCSSNGQLNLI